MFEVAANLRLGNFWENCFIKSAETALIENPIGRSVDMSTIGILPTKSVALTDMLLDYYIHLMFC